MWVQNLKQTAEVCNMNQVLFRQCVAKNNGVNAMKSAPPRGSGGSLDCRLSIAPIGLASDRKAIGNRQSEIENPKTHRYRVVVLTSSPRGNSTANRALASKTPTVHL
jgi:hypothetical protein